MGILSAVRRYRAWCKLLKGQCIVCCAILRDDATDECCSDKCRDAHFLDTFV